MFENSGIKKFTFEMIDSQEMVNQAIQLTLGLIKDGRLKEADVVASQALKVTPDNLEVKHTLGLIKLQQEKYNESLKIFENILEIDPNHTDALNNISIVYGMLGEFGKALNAAKKAVELKPNHATFWTNLGICYAQNENFKQAFECFEKSFSLEPDPNVLVNLGTAYGNLKMIDEAIETYQKALEINNDLPTAHVCLAEAYFFKEMYQKGWEEFEWRFKAHKQLQVLSTVFDDKNKWNGEDLSGKSLFAYSEQGVGDGLQFIRYLKLVKEKYPTSKIILHSTSEVKSLYEYNNLADEYVDCSILNKTEHGNYDYHCSLLSLPFILNFPQINPPYLETPIKADFDNYKDYFKIGICWAGNPQHPNDKNRSCHLSNFKSIYDIPGVKLFSLQKDYRKRLYRSSKIAVDLSSGCEDMKIVDLSEWMPDFLYTAALINEMDLIISVDTSILHMAGALNKNTIAAIPFNPDWRWGLNNDHIHWYPNTKIIRQTTPNNWKSVFDVARKQIISCIENKCCCV